MNEHDSVKASGWQGCAEEGQNPAPVDYLWKKSE